MFLRRFSGIDSRSRTFGNQKRQERSAGEHHCRRPQASLPNDEMVMGRTTEGNETK